MLRTIISLGESPQLKIANQVYLPFCGRAIGLPTHQAGS